MIVTTTKKLAKETKSLFCELPYNGFNFIDFHGQFNNSLTLDMPRADIIGPSINT